MDRYPLGQPVRVSTTVTDTAGNLGNAGALSLVVRKPDGTSQTYNSPTNDGPGLYHQDIGGADLTQVGNYQYEWVATGTNAGVSSRSFTVYDPLAVPDLEAWRPTSTQVAKYIPERTLPANQTSDNPVNDFTAATTPTAAQADSHIDDAQSWVFARTGTLDPTMYLAGSAVVALRAAGMIEMSYPVRDGDINTAQALLAQADLMLERLVLANEAANPGTSAPGVLSAWQFPDPVPWGDRIDIF